MGEDYNAPRIKCLDIKVALQFVTNYLSQWLRSLQLSQCGIWWLGHGHLVVDKFSNIFSICRAAQVLGDKSTNDVKSIISPYLLNFIFFNSRSPNFLKCILIKYLSCGHVFPPRKSCELLYISEYFWWESTRSLNREWKQFLFRLKVDDAVIVYCLLRSKC